MAIYKGIFMNEIRADVTVHMPEGWDVASYPSMELPDDLTFQQKCFIIKEMLDNARTTIVKSLWSREMTLTGKLYPETPDLLKDLNAFLVALGIEQ